MAGDPPIALDIPALSALGIDAGLIARREQLDGRPAVEFLAELPRLVADYRERLGLTDARIMPGGVLSAALRCTRVTDGRDVVLKLSASSATSAPAEAAALAVWSGEGACALEWTGDEARAMLLELIVPGDAVEPRAESADAGHAGALLRVLHHNGAVPAAIPQAPAELRWRFERAHEKLDGPSYARGLIDHDGIDTAYGEALALHESASRRALLHGDFIAKNVLIDAELGWRAIDPRPCIGDPCLDAGFWALSYRPGVRVRSACELVAGAAGLDGERVWRWARAFAVSEAVLVTDAERARAHHAVSLRAM